MKNDLDKQTMYTHVIKPSRIILEEYKKGDRNIINTVAVLANTIENMKCMEGTGVGFSIGRNGNFCVAYAPKKGLSKKDTSEIDRIMKYNGFETVGIEEVQ